MPLKRGSSKKVRSENIGEMLHKFKATGKIGNAHPKSMAQAKKIAAAAAYAKSKKKKK